MSLILKITLMIIQMWKLYTIEDNKDITILLNSVGHVWWKRWRSVDILSRKSWSHP